MFSSQITFLQYGQQETYQLRMIKRSKKKRLREKNAQGQLLLYQLVIQLPDFLSLKWILATPPHHLLLKVNTGSRVGELCFQPNLMGAAEPGSGYSLLGREVMRVFGRRSSLGMVGVAPGARIRLCYCIRNDKCEGWECWCFVEIFQVKQYCTKSLLFCLASIPSLYAYQRIHLYFFKHVAFSTTKLWLFNDAQ